MMTEVCQWLSWEDRLCIKNTLQYQTFGFRSTSRSAKSTLLGTTPVWHYQAKIPPCTDIGNSYIPLCLQAGVVNWKHMLAPKFHTPILFQFVLWEVLMQHCVVLFNNKSFWQNQSENIVRWKIDWKEWSPILCGFLNTVLHLWELSKFMAINVTMY